MSSLSRGVCCDSVADKECEWCTACKGCVGDGDGVRDEEGSVVAIVVITGTGEAARL